jgi:hypothetical protein
MGIKIEYIILTLVILLFPCCTRVTFVHDYNYKTIIDEHPDKYDYNHFNNKSFDDLCEIEYGFLKYPKIIKAYDIDGKLIARCGSPFTFFIDFNDINKDIEYIKFDSIELLTKSRTFNLLDIEDISYQTYIFYNGYRKEPNHDTKNNNFFWEKDDSQTLKNLNEDRSVSIIGLRSKGYTYFTEWIEKSEYDYNEDERKMLLEERKFRFLFHIKYIPVNIVDDEEVRVKVSLLFKSANGNIQHIQFDDVYFREYTRIKYRGKLFFELLQEEKDVKL